MFPLLGLYQERRSYMAMKIIIENIADLWTFLHMRMFEGTPSHPAGILLRMRGGDGVGPLRGSGKIPQLHKI